MSDYKGGAWVLSDRLKYDGDDADGEDWENLSYNKEKDVENGDCMEKEKGWSGDWSVECVSRYGDTTTIEPSTTSVATTTFSTQEPDEKSCWFTDDFKRQCDVEVGKRPRPDTPEECLEECRKHPHCDKAHWHPGNQIWQDDSRPVCFMFGVGSGTCDWNGWEGPDAHPGAQMIHCDPPTCSLEKKYQPNLCVSGKEGAYCDFDENNEKTICYSCEFIETPLDCSDSNDEKASTCLQG